jgi:hypothetical protein
MQHQLYVAVSEAIDDHGTLKLVTSMWNCAVATARGQEDQLAALRLVLTKCVSMAWYARRDQGDVCSRLWQRQVTLMRCGCLTTTTWSGRCRFLPGRADWTARIPHHQRRQRHNRQGLL